MCSQIVGHADHFDPQLKIVPGNAHLELHDPVQATANNLDTVRARTASRMALQGGVSSGLIVAGPIPAIRAEVCQRIWQLGRDGGYFCGPDQGMPWPQAHIQALLDAVAEFGTYPLREPVGNQMTTETKSAGDA